MGGRTEVPAEDCWREEVEESLDPFWGEDEDVDWEDVMSSKREMRDPLQSVAEPQPVDIMAMFDDVYVEVEYSETSDVV